MQGGIRKRGEIWYYYYEIKTAEGGRKKIERKAGPKKQDAVDLLNDTLYKLKNGYIEPKKMTIDQYITDWLEGFIKENRKTNTYDRYVEVYNYNIKDYIGGLLLKDLRPIHIENMLNDEKKKKQLSGSTLQGIYGVLNSALNKAVKLQIINDNPCRFIDRPKREKFKANTLNVDEIHFIIDALSSSDYNDHIMKLALRIVLELGLRRGELSGLEWRNIDWKTNTIKIENNLVYTNKKVILESTKTDESERTLYVSDILLKLLKEQKKLQTNHINEYGNRYAKNKFFDKRINAERECDFIMTWEDGRYVHPNYYTYRFKKVLRKLKFAKEVRFHDLRHTNATLLLEQGVDFKTIQTRLGHADINTTLNIYSHVNLSMQKKATDKLTKILSK